MDFENCKIFNSRYEKFIPFNEVIRMVKLQVPEFPKRLLFFCEEEPGSGGETPIVLSHVVYEKMKERHPEFVSRLEEHGLSYTKVLTNEVLSSYYGGMVGSLHT